jgi:hypothetical protein
MQQNVSVTFYCLLAPPPAGARRKIVCTTDLVKARKKTRQDTWLYLFPIWKKTNRRKYLVLDEKTFQDMPFKTLKILILYLKYFENAGRGKNIEFEPSSSNFFSLRLNISH